MRTIVVVADAHIGNHKDMGGVSTGGVNERCEVCISALNDALTFAQNNHADTFIVAGDLFDSDRPPPQVITRVQRVFDEFRYIRHVVIAGNHDQRSEAPGDHALGPLYETVRTVIDTPQVTNNIMCLPYFREGVKIPTTDIKVIVGHAGLIPNNADGWMQLDKSAIDPKSHTLPDGAVALFGHWHHHRVLPNNFYQVGALVQRTFSDGPGGWVAVVNLTKSGATVEWHQLNVPQFITVTEDEFDAARVSGNYVRVACTSKTAGDTVKRVKSAGALGVKALIDDADVRRRVEEAAASVTSSVNLEAAVHQYVEKNVLNKDIAPLVVAAALKYLGKK